MWPSDKSANIPEFLGCLGSGSPELGPDTPSEGRDSSPSLFHVTGFESLLSRSERPPGRYHGTPLRRVKGPPVAPRTVIPDPRVHRGSGTLSPGPSGDRVQSVGDTYRYPRPSCQEILKQTPPATFRSQEVSSEVPSISLSHLLRRSTLRYPAPQISRSVKNDSLLSVSPVLVRGEVV